MSNEAYDLPGKLRLVALINEDNNTSFNLDVFRFGLPEISYGARNTAVRVEVKSSVPIEGGQNFYYNRLNLSTFFGGGILTIPFTEAETSMDIAAAINEQFGTAIEEEDIVLEPVFGLFHVLKSVPTSYAWTGQVAVKLTAAELRLSDILTTQILSGMSFPSINGL